MVTELTPDDIREKYHARSLDPDDGYKPLDFGGNGGITGSIDRYGRITAINMYHNKHGYVTLTAAEPFPEDQRYNPQVVREYRRSLVDLDGFGLHFDLNIIKTEAWMLEDAIPHIRLTFENGATAECTTFVPENNPKGLLQLWQFSGHEVPMRWSGRVSLQRAAYTQLTEGGPIFPPRVEVDVTYDRNMLIMENPALDWAAAISYLTGHKELEENADGSMDVDIPVPYHNSDRFVCFAIGFGATADMATQQSQILYNDWAFRSDITKLLEYTLQTWNMRWDGWRSSSNGLDKLVRHGLAYSLFCAVPVDGTVCLITDHQLLPLSWNRDAYYVARVLLAWRPEFSDLVRRHLLWLFEVAERQDHLWGRSYLVSGKIKDPAFQLDQQIFPLLELAKYVEVTGDVVTLRRLEPHIAPITYALLRREVPNTGLFPTEETPADDPVEMPYHLSSHMLLWHTLRKLGKQLNERPMLSISERVYRAIWKHFVVEKDGKKIFAYLTDGYGNHQCYHDANDIPLALAPIWNFCQSDDPVWRNTIDFAFSEANEGGFYAGECGGLGSIHTRATWPLGDVQEFIIAQILGDQDRLDRVSERLLKAAQWDGALSEAYDPHTARVVSRHWFSWTGAALALYDKWFATETF